LTQLFNIFSLLAILITCSGLFSLVALIIRKRTKEIGIRKVMGASVKSIFLLICRDFVRLIIFSFIIAMPFAYFILNRWLQQYAYRTKLYWWLFVLAGGITILIALVTISWKSLFAARANPVDSLRDE
jgi:putative ABC transport system permease protein